MDAINAALHGQTFRHGLIILRRVGLVGLCLLSLALTFKHVVLADWSQPPFDWTQFDIATQRLDGANLYAWEAHGSFEYSYRYSPLFAYLIVPVVTVGLTVWRLLHVAALLLLPWRIVAITLLAWPFWEDVYHANVMTFAFAFGWLSVAGSRWATAAYLALTLLVPRPLMVPLVVWLLWKRPEWRLPALAMVVGFVILTVATGEAEAFASTLLRSDDMVTFERNFGPSRFVGLWWLAIGIPLGAWLTAKGHLGYASLAAGPYLLPYHFLMGLLETARGQLNRSEGAAAPSTFASIWRGLRTVQQPRRRDEMTKERQADGDGRSR